MNMKRANEAPDFVVDEDHGALINTNANGLAAYKAARAAAIRNNDVYNRVERLEDAVNRIEQLLLRVLEK